MRPSGGSKGKNKGGAEVITAFNVESKPKVTSAPFYAGKIGMLPTLAALAISLLTFGFWLSIEHQEETVLDGLIIGI